MTGFSMRRRWKNRFLQILLRYKQLLLPNRENKSDRLSLTSVHVMESIPQEKDPGYSCQAILLKGLHEYTPYFCRLTIEENIVIVETLDYEYKIHAGQIISVHMNRIDGVVIGQARKIVHSKDLMKILYKESGQKKELLCAAGDERRTSNNLLRFAQNLNVFLGRYTS